ncbi:MAG: hypothetical protein KKB13_20510, partial [Chloroflexi bacterium]|nr:hypothetical protein [Chloroflexota bacterium]
MHSQPHRRWPAIVLALALLPVGIMLLAPVQAQVTYDHFAYLPLIRGPENAPPPTPAPWGPWQQGGNTDNIRFYCTAAADGDVTYAGSSQGVYRSTDQGQTWHKRGLDGQGIPALLALPGTTQVYAGVSHAGVYYSSDGGGTWSERNAGLNAMDVTTLVARPGTPTTLYAGLYGAPGVARSTDGGAH